MSTWYQRAGKLFLGATMLFASTGSFSAVVLPALDLRVSSGDAGIVSNAGGITMDGTAFTVVLDGSNTIDIPDVDFLLTSDNSGAGNLTVDGGSLLSASFSNFSIISLGANDAWFAADLTFTGGNMVGSLIAGRIEGILDFASIADPALGADFTSSFFRAKVGQVVVPVPAAIWLFGSGLLGLAAIARKKAF